MMGQMFARGWSGGNWDSTPDFMKNMMQQYWGGVQPFWGLAGIIDLVQEVLILILLVAAIRWLWRKGDK